MTRTSRRTRTKTPPTTSDARTPPPPERPSRTIVEAVRPVVDGGRFAAKGSLGRPVKVEADVFTDGHDLVAASLLVRCTADDRTGGDPGAGWQEHRMVPVVNDRLEATFVPDRLGRWEYDVVGWLAHAETWRQGTMKKIDAGLDVSVELEIGRRMVAAAVTSPNPAATDADIEALRSFAEELANGDGASVHDERWVEILHRAEPREPVDRLAQPVPVDVDPVLATIGSWYSFFPRSTVGRQGDDASPATLRDAIDRLDYIADMGFDVVYVPPVHPIGTTNRKGRNNTTLAEPDAVGSPYAIGSAAGGHTAVAPELGTVADVTALADGCRARGMQLALDIAFNCSPDHPWVKEHPDWFVTRPDGTIQYAENPPKKYEDIYPLDFDTADWQALWRELADVFRFWIDKGVTIFRVDNPHTKAFAFWEWALTTLRAERPDLVFLSEAFTRPRVMERLAKVGFNQSYTYFAWRQNTYELREYFEELSTRTLDYLRPNAWPNTHDILTEQLQHGGRPAFVTRAILAATLSPSWGVYGPVYELLVDEPRPGVEDYLDSEKYEVRHWDLDHPDSLAPLLGHLNHLRREHPALTDLASITFHDTSNDQILCFTKTDPIGVGHPVMVIVNVDPFEAQAGRVDIDLAAIGFPYEIEYDLVDRFAGTSHRWFGNDNYVELSPWGTNAHVFTVHRNDDAPSFAPDPDVAVPTPAIPDLGGDGGAR